MHDTLNHPLDHSVTFPGDFRLLYPLDTFYSLFGAPLPAVKVVSGDALPSPFSSLLVHQMDMTPTLEAYYRDNIELRVLDRHLEGDAYSRLVDLTLISSGTIVEFGAIMIDLSLFPSIAREVVLQGQVPLGTILAEHRIEHSSCPQAFIAVEPDAYITQALNMDRPARLYGRRNWLITPDGRTLADILELLPPAFS